MKSNWWAALKEDEKSVELVRQRQRQKRTSKRSDGRTDHSFMDKLTSND